MSLEAIRLISENLRTAVHDGDQPGGARGDAPRKPSTPGLGLANAGGHGGPFPLLPPSAGKYGVSHGLANTIMLPPVMAFNLPGNPKKFVDIAEVMGEIVDNLPSQGGGLSSR